MCRRSHDLGIQLQIIQNDLHFKTKSEYFYTSYSFSSADFYISSLQNVPTYVVDHINPSEPQTSWDLKPNVAAQGQQRRARWRTDGGGGVHEWKGKLGPRSRKLICFLQPPLLSPPQKRRPHTAQTRGWTRSLLQATAHAENTLLYITKQQSKSTGLYFKSKSISLIWILTGLNLFVSI